MMDKLFAKGISQNGMSGLAVIIEIDEKYTKAMKYMGGCTDGVDAEIDALKWGLELAKNMGINQLEVHSNAPIINIRFIEEREMIKPSGSKPRIIKGSMVAPTKHFDMASFQVQQMCHSDFGSVIMLFDEENPIWEEVTELAGRALNRAEER
jgi:hypothetical protein